MALIKRADGSWFDDGTGGYQLQGIPESGNNWNNGQYTAYPSPQTQQPLNQFVSQVQTPNFPNYSVMFGTAQQQPMQQATTQMQQAQPVQQFNQPQTQFQSSAQSMQQSQAPAPNNLHQVLNSFFNPSNMYANTFNNLYSMTPHFMNHANQLYNFANSSLTNLNNSTGGSSNSNTSYHPQSLFGHW